MDLAHAQSMMRTAASVDQAHSIAAEFGLAPRRVERLGRGLINDTFALVDPNDDYVLQRVNPVFRPENHYNILAVTEHLARRGMVTPRLRLGPAGRPWIERQEQVWRLMTRVPGVSIDTIADPSQAWAAAELLARFHSALEDLEHSFVGQREGVHDTPLHLERLRRAISEFEDHRLRPAVESLAVQIEARAEQLPRIDGLPERIMHGDPKLNNVLFTLGGQPDRARAHCWIDLDTVGVMSLAVELGDAWRSWCNPRGEDEPDAHFDLEIYRASVRGYAQGCSLRLTAEEREGLLYGVEWITLELSARFATDALVERYFGWDRQRFPAAAEHNWVRAQGQWSLHEAVVAARAERGEGLGELR